jgi:hypothetical protein
MDIATEALLSGQPVSEAAPAENHAPAVSPAPAAEPISKPTALESGKHDAPDPVQAAGKPTTPATPATSAPATSKQAPAAPSDDELLAAAGLTESPAVKLSRLERDHSASSKEARRLLEYSRGIEEALKDQGVEIAKDENGKISGFVAGKKYTKDIPNLDLKVKELPEEIQAKFDSDPQKVVDFIVDKAKKAMTRIVPTIDKINVPLSPERHATAIGFLAEMKWETGDTKFPGLAANRKLIEQMINNPNGSKALKEFYNQEPETALMLLNLQLDHARTHIATQAQKAAAAIEAKKKASESTPQLTPSGGGSPSIGDPDSNDPAVQVASGRLQMY